MLCQHHLRLRDQADGRNGLSPEAGVQRQLQQCEDLERGGPGEHVPAGRQRDRLRQRKIPPYGERRRLRRQWRQGTHHQRDLRELLTEGITRERVEVSPMG